MTTTGSHGTAGSSPMTRASRWVLAVAIAGSALAVGTVHTVTLCVVTGVLAVAAVMAWWGAEPMKARSAATLLLFTGIGLTAYTALQCVPMPIGWLAVIAPYNADVWSRALVPGGRAGHDLDARQRDEEVILRRASPSPTGAVRDRRHDG